MQSYREVLDHLTRSHPNLSPQLRKAAAYMLENPSDVATLSMRKVAAAAAVPPPTLPRLAQALGFETYDAFLTPVLGAPPMRLGEIDQTKPWDELIEQLYRYVAFTPLANFSGMPAMSVPLHWNAQGLPIGSQFLGRFGDETTLYRLAGQLERARGWWDRRPAIALG